MNDQINAELINKFSDSANKRTLLQVINSALYLAETEDATIDKQYFEELEEHPTISDLLMAISLTLESELYGEPR
jgi:hypothetical protein